jgi:hypothetical protein
MYTSPDALVFAPTRWTSAHGLTPHTSGPDDCLRLALPPVVRLVLIDPSESGHRGAQASAG